MFKNTKRNTVVISSLISSVSFGSEKAVEMFDGDMKNPSHTAISLDPIDINQMLNTHYTTSEQVNFTRDMLWDLERKKAWDPKTYISHVVNEGQSWGRITHENGDESFIRWSNQLQWLTGNYGIVIEKVYLLNKEQKAIFIGVSEAQDENGKQISASTSQALFHVEHGVAGTFDAPLNTWQIVHLTPEKNNVLIQKFNNLREPNTLPLYVEKYIKNDLKIDLNKKYIS